MVCLHQCSEDCRRNGCSCKCGEFHEDKGPERVYSVEQERIIAWHEKICELAKCEGPDHGDHLEAQGILIDLQNSLMKNPAAVALGSIKSEKKAKAARENGKKGGRPQKKTVYNQPEDQQHM